MNILKEYTIDFIKRNKKSSFAIMLAILIATTSLSTFFGFMYTMYRDEIRMTLEEEGNWHAELFDNTTGEMLKYVTGHPNVESVMIMGNWECAKIDDPRRPYLIIRDLTTNYWRDMPEQSLIMEGRTPSLSNEIALSKQYFEYHPGLKIGDTITLPIGNRAVGEKVLEPTSVYKKKEQFLEKEQRTYTIVGKMDITTNSVMPGYLAYGCMDEGSIKPQDQLTVYIRFMNPRSTYTDIAQIARSIGYEKDEYGNYMVKTNERLLMKYFIFSPLQNTTVQLSQLTLPLMEIVLGMIIMTLFVYLIKNAFAMSANERLKQLGIFQSIGASPKQIRRSIVFEGFLLSAIPIPAGIVLGWLFNYALITYINSITNGRNRELFLSFGLPAILPSICFAALTVWFSALLPARKLTRASTIDIIRQGSNDAVKKFKKNKLIFKLFGIEGELARNALTLRKKSYRIAVISLTLSFLLFSSFLMLNAVYNTVKKVVITGKEYKTQRDIMIATLDGNFIEPEAQKQLRGVKGIKSIHFACDTPISIWLTKDMQSEELKAIGGLSRIASKDYSNVYENKGSYHILSNLIAIDDNSFHEYCNRLGINSALFYDIKNIKTIVINTVKDEVHSNVRNTKQIPYLNIKSGDLLTCDESIYNDDTGVYSFTLQAGYITNILPALGKQYPDYQLIQIIPISVYYDLISRFEEENASMAKFSYVSVLAKDKDDISIIATNLTKVCDRWYGSGDYYIFNTQEEEELEKSSKRLIQSIMFCIASFFALIGFVNVFTTVSGNLRHRQRDFAMLQSIGLSAKGMRKMMLLEGLLLGLFPIMINLPIIMLITGIFLRINLIYLYEFVPFVPFLPIAVYAVFILFIITLAYARGVRKLSDISIVNAIKDDTI